MNDLSHHAFHPRRIKRENGLAITTVEPQDFDKEVLLLHGMMAGAWQFKNVQQHLASRGFRTVALDFRHHGQSTGPGTLADCTIADYVDDAKTALSEFNSAPFVIGQSLGGLIGLKLAELGLVRGVAAVCAIPPAGIPWQSTLPLVDTLMPIADDLVGQIVPAAEEELTALLYNGTPTELHHDIFALQQAESGRVVSQAVKNTFDVDASAVRCPVLSVCSDDDQLIVPSVGQRIAEAFSGDILRFPGFGHYAIVSDEDWQQPVGAIADWMQNKTLNSPLAAFDVWSDGPSKET